MKIAVLVGGIAYETQRRLLEGIMKYEEKERMSRECPKAYQFR